VTDQSNNSSNPPDDELRSFPWPKILEFPKREILIPDLAFSAGISTVVAESGGGKTTLVSSASWTVGIGGTWAGKVIKKRPVIWVAGEGQYDLSPMYQAWVNAHPGCPVPEGRFLIEPIDFASASETTKLKKLVEDMEPPVVVTDALADMLGGTDESKNKDMQVIYKNMWQVVFANSASLIVPHHSGWDNNRERGATTIRAKSDIVVQIVNYDPVGGFIELKHHKRRGGAKRLKFTLGVQLVQVEGCPEKVPIVTGEETCQLFATLNQPMNAVDEHARKVVQLMFAANLHDVGFTDLLELTGLHRNTLATALRVAVGNGWLTKGGSERRPKYNLNPDSKWKEAVQGFSTNGTPQEGCGPVCTNTNQYKYTKMYQNGPTPGCEDADTTAPLNPLDNSAAETPAEELKGMMEDAVDQSSLDQSPLSEEEQLKLLMEDALNDYSSMSQPK
jgi:hypothetical protein